MSHCINPTVIAFSSAFDRDGLDCYFLNRAKVEGVVHISQLEATFAQEPTDYSLTPLSSVLTQILHEKRAKFAKGNCVIVIATDGAPLNQERTDSVELFSRTLATRHQIIGLPSPQMVTLSSVLTYFYPLVQECGSRLQQNANFTNRFQSTFTPAPRTSLKLATSRTLTI